VRISTALFLLSGLLGALVALTLLDLTAGAIALLAFGQAAREWEHLA
jgi:hypothetical protein